MNMGGFFWLRCREFWRQRGGNSAVEFALILPLLAMFVLAVISIGWELHNRLVINDAVRMGVHSAMSGERDPTQIAAISTSVLEARGVDARVSATTICTCGASIVSCAQPGCSSGALPEIEVRVNAVSSEGGFSIREAVRVQ